MDHSNNSFIKPLTLKKLTLPNNVIYSPLAGCSDFPFRKIVAKYKPGLQFCEMVKIDALIRNDPNTFRLLDYDASMFPTGAQLCGSNPKDARTAARIIEDLGFPIIDLNCGCPVDKVTKDGSGSGLLKQPKLIGEILSNMIAAVKIPVTVKIRAGWDDTSITATEITKIAEEAGAEAIAIHGRTRAQGYKGNANWEHIKECKQAAKSILVYGNGDIFSAEAADRIFKETGCDGILVSRGTFGNPWLVEDIIRFQEGLPAIERTMDDQRKALLEHFQQIKQYKTVKQTLIDMRRIGCWYLKKEKGTKEFRRAICKAASLQEVEEVIQHYLT